MNQRSSVALLALTPWLALAVACVPPVSPRTVAHGTVSGDVLDAKTREPVAEAVVTLVPLTARDVRGLTTAASGRFSFGGLQAGRYGIEISAPGYALASSAALDVVGGETLPLSVPLVRGEAGSGKPLTLAGWVRPVFISGPEPQYPEQALEHGVEGQVVLACLITEEGAVRNCVVTQSPPYVDDAIRKAFEQRRYRPAQLDGKPVSIRYEFRIQLSIHHKVGE